MIRYCSAQGCDTRLSESLILCLHCNSFPFQRLCAMLRGMLWYVRYWHESTVKVAFSVMISVLQIRAPSAYPLSSKFPRPVIPEHFEPHTSLL